MFNLLILTTIIVTAIYFINKEITTLEYFKTLGIVIVVTLIVYSFSLIPFPNDNYFASGRIEETRFYPSWVEEYQQAHTVCHSNGKSESCTTYYTTEHDRHEAYWVMYDTLDQNWKISSELHAQIKSYFGDNVHISQPNKSTHGGHLVSGDPNVYSYNNDTNIYKYTTTKMIPWYNPIKGSHSLFNEGAGDFKLDYPSQTGQFETNRLMGGGIKHDIDVLNTKIYNTVGANFIVVQTNDFAKCDKLDAYWNGGNYNDIIMCISGDIEKPDNVQAIGYAENKGLQTELESYILEKGITKNSLVGIQDKIQREYKQFDFKQFRYIKRDCPIWVTILAVIAAIVSSYLCLTYFSDNYDRREE